MENPTDKFLEIANLPENYLNKEMVKQAKKITAESIEIVIPVVAYTKEFDTPITREQEDELIDLVKAGKIQNYQIEETFEPYKCAVTIRAPLAEN